MADRRLRSNFAPGTTPWAMRRAQWSALGLTGVDLEKPKIAIVNSSSQLASCTSHPDEIVAPLNGVPHARGDPGGRPPRETLKGREPVRAVLYIDREAGTAVSDVPDPSPGPEEVVVSVDACGLCGSDVHSVQNGQCAPGQILGHEFSGRIAALGSNVTGWTEGQAVAASPLGSCGKCRICARGLAFRCPAAPNIGITAQGAYAQYVAVPARQLVALPPELPLETGSHAEPLSVASQAVKLSGAGPGDPVLVYGAGPIGLYAIMALRLAGAGPIVAAGRSAGRRQAAADVGADAVIDTRELSVEEYANQSGTRFAAVLECSASVGAFTEGLAVLEPGGTCVEVALTPEVASLPLFGMVSEGLHLAGACAFSDDTYRESVAHLAAGRVPVERLVSERVSLDDTPSALKRLQTPGSLVRILSRPWD